MGYTYFCYLGRILVPAAVFCFFGGFLNLGRIFSLVEKILGRCSRYQDAKKPIKQSISCLREISNPHFVKPNLNSAQRVARVAEKYAFQVSVNLRIDLSVDLCRICNFLFFFE